MQPFYKVRDFSTIREMIDQSAELFAQKPAFEIKKNNEHFNITYTQYLADINALSNALLDMGLFGKKIAIISDNRYEYALSYFTIVSCGAVCLPVDKELHSDDIHGIIDISGTDVVFVDSKHLAKLDFDKLKDIKVYCFDYVEGDNKVLYFDDLISRGKKLFKEGKRLWLNYTVDPAAMSVLLFTSGTTGTSKGVMLCQNNFIFEIKAAMGVLKIYPEDCAISLLPFHHTFESSITIFFAPFCGAKIVFCEGFKYVLRNMKEFNPSVFVAVPLVLETVHKRILKEIKKKPHGETKFNIGKKLCKTASRFNIDLKKVVFKEIQETFGGNMRLIICGGAAIDPQVLEDFDSFGIQVLYGYGLTECAPLAIINHDRCVTTDSIGEALPGVETKIIDQDDTGVGELCVKGGMVMLGYYENPEATAEVMDDDGYFHTGDLAYQDGKGRFHITGRSKNVIVTSNGKNIYPEELEYHLDTNDLVSASMVEGVEDKKGETQVHAQILPDVEEIAGVLGREPSDDEIKAAIKDVVANVNEKVPSFKRIKSFTIRKNDFERTTAQKIKRVSNRTTSKSKKQGITKV